MGLLNKGQSRYQPWGLPLVRVLPSVRETCCKGRAACTSCAASCSLLRPGLTPESGWWPL